MEKRVPTSNFSRFRLGEELLEVVDRIHQCSSLEGLRTAYLRAVPKVIEADVYGFYLLDTRLEPTGVFTLEAPAEFLTKYELKGRREDPILAHLIQRREPAHQRSVLGTKQWARHSLGRLMRDWDLEHSLQGPLVARKGIVGTLNFARKCGRPPFSTDDLRTLRYVCRQISAVLGRTTHLTDDYANARMLQDALDVIEVPLLVTRGWHAVEYANRQARLCLLQASTHDTVVGMKQEIVGPLRRNVERLDTGDEQLVEVHAPVGAVDGVSYVVQTRSLSPAENLYITVLLPQENGPLEVGIRKDIVLSNREREILSLLVQGLNNREIASRLFISENTVKDHLKRLYRKAGVSSRLRLACLAQSIRCCENWLPRE
jgi:DNA-binding CsgD family transcriptional regulator